jgi:hypothetical protein
MWKAGAINELEKMPCKEESQSYRGLKKVVQVVENLWKSRKFPLAFWED